MRPIPCASLFLDVKAVISEYKWKYKKVGIVKRRPFVPVNLYKRKSNHVTDNKANQMRETITNAYIIRCKNRLVIRYF